MIRIQQSNSDASVLFLGTRTQPAAPDLEVTPGVAPAGFACSASRSSAKAAGKKNGQSKSTKDTHRAIPNDRSL